MDINKSTVETYHSIYTFYKTGNKTSICNLNPCCWSNVQSFLPKILAFLIGLNCCHKFQISQA